MGLDQQAHLGGRALRMLAGQTLAFSIFSRQMGRQESLAKRPILATPPLMALLTTPSVRKSLPAIGHHCQPAAAARTSLMPCMAHPFPTMSRTDCGVPPGFSPAHSHFCSSSDTPAPCCAPPFCAIGAQDVSTSVSGDVGIRAKSPLGALDAHPRLLDVAEFSCGPRSPPIPLRSILLSLPFWTRGNHWLAIGGL